MLKYALSQGDDFGVHLVSPGTMTKVAGMLPAVEEFIATLRPDPRYLYTLVNAMGYSEFYGPNSNVDWYGYNPHLKFNGLLHDPNSSEATRNEYRGWETDPVVHARLAKSWAYGYPTFYGAAVYAHHKNTDRASLGFGDVIFACRNELMKRIELVMRIDVKLAEERGHSAILSRILRGDRCDVSMGCKIPFDLCSVCTDWDTVRLAWGGFDPSRHKSPGVAILAYHRTVKPIRGLAVTKADYCSCMLTARGKILPSGEKVFVYNDFCAFFDISVVWVGADRTARVMWHMLPSGVLAPTESNMKFASAAEGRSKVASLETPATKRAEMEKEVTGGIARKIDLCAKEEEDLPFGPLGIFTKTVGARTLLSTLAGMGIVLKPQEFHHVVSRGNTMQEKVAAIGVENNVTFDTESPGFDPKYAVSAEDFDVKLAHELLGWVMGRSSFAPYLHVRLARSEKRASPAVSPDMYGSMVRDVVGQYSAYRASFLKESALLFPKYHSVVQPSTEDLLKHASPTRLLLSPFAVVHCLSAHLNKVASAEDEVGRAMKYVTDSPGCDRLSSVGASIYQHMTPTTNFYSALKTAVHAAL